MPLYRLTNEDKSVVKVWRMSHEIAEVLNNELEEIGDRKRWMRGIGSKSDGRHKVRSLEPILRDLDIEGFDEHSVNTIENYLNQNVKEVVYKRSRYNRIKDTFVESTRSLPPKTREAIGKFMSQQCAHSFEAGLRLGIGAHYVKDWQDWTEEEDVS